MAVPKLQLGNEAVGLELTFCASGWQRGAEAAMASNEYHFISDWQVEGTVEEVSTIITDTVSLPRWWPSVYLDDRA